MVDDRSLVLAFADCLLKRVQRRFSQSFVIQWKARKLETQMLVKREEKGLNSRIGIIPTNLHFGFPYEETIITWDPVLQLQALSPHSFIRSSTLRPFNWQYLLMVFVTRNHQPQLSWSWPGLDNVPSGPIIIDKMLIRLFSGWCNVVVLLNKLIAFSV